MNRGNQVQLYSSPWTEMKGVARRIMKDKSWGVVTV